MHNTHFRLNAPNCISEEIEGDLIVINLSTGRYYNMRGISVKLWKALVNGASPSSIITANNWSVIQQSSMLRFLESLMEEGLLVKNDTPAQHVAQEVLFISILEDDLFQMDVFSDMEEILGLDPIHEADIKDAGWPTKAS
jgi:predicted RNA-binding protein